MVDLAIVEVFITLFTANRLETERFEILPELLLITVAADEDRQHAAGERLGTLDVQGVALARPSHTVGVFFTVQDMLESLEEV